MLGQQQEYVGPDIGLGTFLGALNWESDFNERTGWSRPRLSEAMRRSYGMPVVSWAQGMNTDRNPSAGTLERMQQAGYISSQPETNFYLERAAGRGVLEIVAGGTPVIAGMVPGFAHNKSVHAVILNQHDTGSSRVHVIDPDERNENSWYDAAYVAASLNPVGAASVVLPSRV